MVKESGQFMMSFNNKNKLSFLKQVQDFKAKL